MISLGEIVSFPRLLPGWLLQGMLQLVPTGKSSKESIRPVNLPLSPCQIEIVSGEINVLKSQIILSDK